MGGIIPLYTNYFDKVSTDLKLFTIFTSAEMFYYFADKFGERDFTSIMILKMQQIIQIW